MTSEIKVRVNNYYVVFVVSADIRGFIERVNEKRSNECQALPTVYHAYTFNDIGAQIII